MDTFIVWTPLLLLPIALLLLFAGCSLLYSIPEPKDPDVSVVVSFYPASIGSACSTFLVAVGGLAANDIEETVAVMPKGNGRVELVLETVSVSAEQKAAITCTVFDPCAADPTEWLVRMANDAQCGMLLEEDHTYSIVFSANENRRRFPDCQIIDTTA